MSDAGAPIRPTLHRRRWHRIVALVFALAVVIAGYLLNRHYTDPQRILGFAEAYLQRYVRGRVTVRSAGFSWWTGIRLFDVAVSEVPRSGRPGLDTREPGDIFSCREVRLRHNGVGIIRDGLVIESITALEPTCTIVRDVSDGRTNLVGLIRVPQEGDPEVARPRGPLPTIELRDARVRVVSREDKQDRLVEDLTLTLRARPSATAPRVYNVVWQEANGRTAGGHSQIDLRTGRLRNVSGGLPWMSIEAVMLVIDARYDGAGAWCGLLGLDGTVRAKDYSVVGDAPDPGDRYATIELSQTRISIPISEEERPLPPDERYLRFDHVDGGVQVTSHVIRTEFTGLFHGSPCKVSATLHGGTATPRTLGDVGFDARLSISRWGLPSLDAGRPAAEARFIRRWPRLTEIAADYDPHGPVDLDVEIAKEPGDDNPVVIRRALLTARGGDASYHHFPYRGHDLAGAIEFTPEGVFIRGITGRHGGGTVTIDGHLEAPTVAAAKYLTIRGTAIPIDRELIEALPESEQRIPKLFDPSGTVDVRADSTQPQGTPEQPGEWRTRVEIELVDVAAAYAEFPYPVERLTGILLVEPDHIRIQNVAGRSGNAKIAVDGEVKLADGRPGELDLTINATDVPFDDKLFAALPEQTGRQLGTFHPTGRFDVKTSLQLDEDSRDLLLASAVTLKQTAIRPEPFPVDVTDVTGRVSITPDEIVLDGLTGRYRGATVSAEGTIGRTGDGPRVAVVVRSRDLRIDDVLRDALPEKLRDHVASWSVDGPLSTETVISRHPNQPEPRALARTVVGLSGAQVTHPRFSTPFDNVQGELVIDRAGIRSDNMTARYGCADAHATLDIGSDDGGERGTFTMSVTGGALDSSLRDLLPPAARRVWDRLKPSGAVDVHLSSLEYRRAGDAELPQWTVTGYAEFDGVAVPGAADLQRVTGTLMGSGALVDRDGGTSLHGSLAIAGLSALGQRLEQVNGDWSFVRTTSGEGLLLMDPVRGRMYDGALTGRIEVSFDEDRAAYNLSTTLHKVQIEPLVKVEETSRSSRSEPANVRGLLNAHLYVSGPVDDPRSRRGGGRFEIIDGHIYRLPLILAILHVLDLSVPEQDAFDEARAEFVIDGNRVEIRDLVLRGSVLALKGTGSITLPDRGLDLNLVSFDPSPWISVPVLTDLVEAASREVVELHVAGPLSQPTVRARPFRGVTDEFKRLFRRRAPKAVEPEKP